MPLHITLLFYAIVFLYGIVIGSFLNVCICRMPEGESLLPSSHCMSCGHKLHWYDLFPLFSWLLLRGRCRYCGEKISFQYPLIEAVNGILYVVVFMANGISVTSILYCLMASALIVISVIDERTYLIPPACNVFLLLVGIGVCIADREQLAAHLIGMFSISVPLSLLYLLSKGRAIGGGDIKLMASVGLILGWQNTVLAFFLACILGSVIHLLRIKLTKAEHMLAMGPYLSAASFLAALFGEQMIGWYLGLLGI